MKKRNILLAILYRKLKNKFWTNMNWKTYDIILSFYALRKNKISYFHGRCCVIALIQFRNAINNQQIFVNSHRCLWLILMHSLKYFCLERILNNRNLPTEDNECIWSAKTIASILETECLLLLKNYATIIYALWQRSNLLL